MFKSEKGVSAVEFALIAPLLFVLTFGIIEFSILLFDKAVVTNASREGARAAIVYHELYNDDGSKTYDPAREDVIRPIVKNYANGYLINLGNSGQQELTDDDIMIEWDPEEPESEGDVTVTVTYTYDFLVLPNLIDLLPGVTGTFDGTISLEGKTVMRME